jgi:FKBP-type peptidyl-prolyl cis-trans isomerase SlpA
MHYSLRLANGTEAESTFGVEPLCFVVGDGSLDPGLERRLYGLREGEKHRLVLAPGEVYGYPDPANVHTLPLSNFPDDLPVSPGMLIGFETPGGQELPGVIQVVTENTVTVDFNHPLSGQQLLLEVQVLAVRPAS